MKKKKESIIQQEIICKLSELAHENNFVFHANINESFMIAIKILGGKNYRLTAWLKKMGLTPKIPDISISHNGKSYYFEVKSKFGKLDPGQITMRNKILKTNCKHAVVKSLGEAVDQLFEWGII